MPEVSWSGTRWTRSRQSLAGRPEANWRGGKSFAYDRAMRSTLVIALLGACGGGGTADGLDCAYLASEDNCFKVTASAAASCLPPATELGVLAADNASCTYATGHVVTFTPALVLPLANDHPWNFEVTSPDGPCLAYQDDEGGFQLTVLGEVVSEELVGRGLELSCPDGSVVGNSNALELLSCPDGNFGDLPGNASSSSETSVVFSLINTGSGATLKVFDCQ